MSDQAGETPAVLTPRLVFDDNMKDEEIPRFLKKDRKIFVEDEEADYAPARITEPEIPAAVNEPAVSEGDQAAEIVEDTYQGLSETAEPSEVTMMEDPGMEGGNLDEMSVEELQRQQEEIDRKIREKREAEKRSVIDQIVQVVNTYKIPVDELVEALGGLKVKRKGVKAKPKYQGPNGEIWSGRGKEPAWIKGKDRKPFEIR